MHPLIAVLILQHGLWSVDTTFGPAAKGDLVIRRTAAGWSAEIAGRRAEFRPSGDSIRFVLPDSSGFRGVLARGRIMGFWIQPPGVTLGQSYATPLALAPSGTGQWRGTVVPLADRFRLYLSITRNPDGSDSAVFRNPESNWLSAWYRFGVTRSGDSVLLDIPERRRQRAIHVGARYDSAAGTLALRFPIIDRVVLLRPQDSATATSLYLRVPRHARYVYRPPPALADGWRTAPARSVGIDEAALAKLVQQIADTDPLAETAPLMHSLLIARHGRLVLEEYFAGYDRATPHDTRSGGKTFAGVMVGAVHLDPATPVKDSVTVGHLLTHTSGLACDDNDDNSPGNEDNMQSQTAQPDWWQYILAQPQVHAPGTVYAYCSGGMNLVGYALHQATGGEWIPELFDRTVARPLGFGLYHYNLMPTLDGYLGGGVHLLPRDLLKLGAAYLAGGTWNGRRIVDSSWVRRSTTTQVAPGVGRDGYAWHLFPIKVGDREYREYEANGNGGQFLIVVPELDLAVVFTGGNYMYGDVWWKWRQQIVGGVIIPAMH